MYMNEVSGWEQIVSCRDTIGTPHRTPSPDNQEFWNAISKLKGQFFSASLLAAPDSSLLASLLLPEVKDNLV